MTGDAEVAELTRQFHLVAFCDHLSLEAGHSPHTIAAYRRDVLRLAAFCRSRGVTSPTAIDAALLRDFVFLLKDLGLSGATIRRTVSAVRTDPGATCSRATKRASRRGWTESARS